MLECKAKAFRGYRNSAPGLLMGYRKLFRVARIPAKSLKILVARGGLEPPTYGL